MINFSLKRQYGAATLLITTLLLVSITMIVIFAANYSMMQQKISGNNNRNQQAFEAAEAGLEYGINYLQQNSATILATRVSGFVQPYSDSNTSNVTLANGSKYTIVYTNPIANNYNLIQIASTGTSDDGTATRTVTQQVKYGSLLYTTPQNSLVSLAGVTLKGSSQINNTFTNATIKSGAAVSFAGSAQTTISTGVGSNSSHTGSDVQQNVAALASTSTADLFSSYFGLSMTTVKSNSAYVFSNLGNYSSSLNGLTGTSIWLDQPSGSATINGSTVIGSATNPVLLIVNGSLNIAGSAVIYGFVYVIGGQTTDIDITGSATINGALVTDGNLDLKGSTTVNYNPNILNTLQQNVMPYYAKVPGTWRDN
jgi:Tfp pilus assembly protein PilX